MKGRVLIRLTNCSTKKYWNFDTGSCRSSSSQRHWLELHHFKECSVSSSQWWGLWYLDIVTFSWCAASPECPIQLPVLKSCWLFPSEVIWITWTCVEDNKGNQLLTSLYSIWWTLHIMFRTQHLTMVVFKIYFWLFRKSSLKYFLKRENGRFPSWNCVCISVTFTGLFKVPFGVDFQEESGMKCSISCEMWFVHLYDTFISYTHTLLHSQLWIYVHVLLHECVRMLVFLNYALLSSVFWSSVFWLFSCQFPVLSAIAGN